MYPARDIANNVRELNNAADPERSPYFVYEGDRLVLDTAYQKIPALQPLQIALQDFGYQLSIRSRMLQAINAAQRFIKLRLAMATVKERAQKAGMANPEYSIYQAPTSPAMQTAWNLTERYYSS